MSKTDVVQSHMEWLMGELLSDLDVTIDDGEVSVCYESAIYRVRVRAQGDDPHIEVYSVVVEGIDRDPGLFEAINDINRRLSHGHMFWADNRVIVDAEILGADCTLEQLVCICGEIGHIAHRQGPKLAAVYGGKTANQAKDGEGS